MPSFYILYFVEEKHRPFPIHFLMTLQQPIEVLRTEILQTFVLKVHIEYLIPFSSFGKQLLDTMI